MSEEEEYYNPLNIISLNEKYHKALHNFKLDIEFLPTLYPLYKEKNKNLKSKFLELVKNSQKLNPDNWETNFNSLLIKYIPSNYIKTIKNTHPEFFKKELSHLLS